MKTVKQLERIFKGIANHRRISILFLIHRSPGITLIDIAEELNGNFKTISEHTKKLVSAGLVNKKYRNKMVTHTLSPYGKKTIRILKSF